MKARELDRRFHAGEDISGILDPSRATRPNKEQRGVNKAVLALILLVPAPSLGTLAGMVLFPHTTLGTALFAAAKVWLLAFPLVWHLCIDRERLSLSPPRHGGFIMGIGSGFVLSVAILAAFAACGPLLVDRAVFVRKITEVGLGSVGLYGAGAAYWILINSVLEEYVWRWFCVKQCMRIMPSWAAVACCC